MRINKKPKVVGATKDNHLPPMKGKRYETRLYNLKKTYALKKYLLETRLAFETFSKQLLKNTGVI